VKIKIEVWEKCVERRTNLTSEPKFAQLKLSKYVGDPNIPGIAKKKKVFKIFVQF
jgi:hypothetical protein